MDCVIIPEKSLGVVIPKPRSTLPNEPLTIPINIYSEEALQFMMSTAPQDAL